MSASLHSARKHSKFSASGSERWFNCPGSVELSEGQPDIDTKWSLEGTHAHELLDEVLSYCIRLGATFVPNSFRFERGGPREMQRHVISVANFILSIHRKSRGSEFKVESRVALPFIHPAMFGTYDAAIAEHFGTLHVFDFKYGQGHAVSPGTPSAPNLQMIFYGIGVAAQFDWNFKRVRLWIAQPRIKGYSGPVFVELSILELWAFVAKFRKAAERVEREPDTYVEGAWCYWCKAKSVCPLKQQAKMEQAKLAFSSPIQGE